MAKDWKKKYKDLEWKFYVAETIADHLLKENRECKEVIDRIEDNHAEERGNLVRRIDELEAKLEEYKKSNDESSA